MTLSFVKALFVRSFLFVCLLWGSAFSAVENTPEAIEKALFDSHQLSASYRLKESYLKKLQEIQQLDANTEATQAFNTVLQSEYYMMAEKYREAQQLMESANLAHLKSSIAIDTKDWIIMYLYRINGEIQKAIELGEQLRLRVKANWPVHRRIELFLELAYQRVFTYEYAKSLDFLELALMEVSNTSDLYLLGEAYNLMGIVYDSLQDKETAAKYFEKSLEVYKKTDFNTFINYTKLNLAQTYIELGREEDAQKIIDKVYESFNEANNESGQAYYYQVQAKINFGLEKYDNALSYIDKAIKMAKKLDEQALLYDMNLDLIEILVKKKDFTAARQLIDKVKATAIELASSRNYKLIRLEAEVLAGNGNYEQAYLKLFGSYKNYRDNFNRMMIRLATVSRSRLDKERLSFENHLLEETNAWNQRLVNKSSEFNVYLKVLIILLVLAFFVLLWFMYRTQKVAAENKRLALTDNLTAMPNRRHIFRELEKHHYTQSNGQGYYSIILFDLDHFKTINDIHGHGIGDKVIKITKEICLSVIRETDTVGRIGGEEFLVILPDTELKAAQRIAERIREAFENYSFSQYAEGLVVTSSFGVAQYRITDPSVSDVINRADKMLYQAKNEGRNRVYAT